MRITAKLLREKGACKSNVIDFEARWPEGCDVTSENCETAFGELELDVDWAATRLLSREARAEYFKIKDVAWKECVKTKSWGEYEKAYIAAFCELAQQST